MPYENTPILLNPEQARRAKADHPGARELSGRAKIVMDDWSVAKAREDCTPFTLTSYTKPKVAA